MKKLVMLIIGLMILMSCTDDTNPSNPIVKDGSIFLFNGLGDVGTLSIVSDDGAIDNDVMNVGKWPNHIIENNGTLFVVNSGNNNIQMIDAALRTNLGSLELSAFSNPMRSAVCNGKVYATNSYGAGIDVYSFSKDSLKNIAITGVPSENINGGTDAILTNGTKVLVGVKNVTYDTNWIAQYGEEYIVVIDAVADTVITSFVAGINIADMLINDENELHVLSTGNRDNIGGFVRVFDLASINYNNFSQVDLGSQPGSFCLNSEGMVYVAVSGLNPDWSGFGGIMKYNSINNEIINGDQDLIFSSTESGIMDICSDSYGNIYAPLFDNNELVILENDTVNTILTTGNGPQGLVFVGE